MKEPYIEELATYDDPESCGLARKGSRTRIKDGPGAEALTGGNPGRVLSREIWFGVRTSYGISERNIGCRVIASGSRTPRGLRPLAWTDTFCAGIGRSHFRPWELAPKVRSLNPKGVRS
jgi:hypothetical protein